jgi:hypothetical protein
MLKGTGIPIESMKPFHIRALHIAVAKDVFIGHPRVLLFMRTPQNTPLFMAGMNAARG